MASGRVVTRSRVAIVGAGFGGLGLAVRLEQAGDDFVVFEEGPEVGGIWQWNTYPGCGCDVPSHLYSYSFARYRDGTVRYPRQPEILAYLRGVADDFGIRPHLRLNTPITSAVWDDPAAHWTLTTAGGDEHIAAVVVFAVGQLHRPFVPELPGGDRFRGAVFHTAEWDHRTDLAGRDVAVIGTGSSAAQMIPRVAETALRVTVYQRTANWVIPKPGPRFDGVTRWLLRRFPGAHTAYRAVTWLVADAVGAPVIQRGWSARPVRWLARWHLRRQVPDPGLRSHLTPDHEPGCKRIVVDSDYYPALQRPNVELVTDPVDAVTPTGIDAGGVHRPADVLVYATGFRTSEFLVPLTVRGRGGVDLQKRWQDGAEAYLGMTLPEFPNLILIHGPNTILGHNSNVFIIECQARYVMRWLELLRGDRVAVEVKPEVMEAYRRWLGETVRRTVWQGGCRSWYMTPSGRVVNSWPTSAWRYWWVTRRDPAGEYQRVGVS
jgi:cation diffusion facilitator CzcD-associated flavoprotein CzcO